MACVRERSTSEFWDSVAYRHAKLGGLIFEGIAICNRGGACLKLPMSTIKRKRNLRRCLWVLHIPEVIRFHRVLLHCHLYVSLIGDKTCYSNWHTFGRNIGRCKNAIELPPWPNFLAQPRTPSTRLLTKCKIDSWNSLFGEAVPQRDLLRREEEKASPSALNSASPLPSPPPSVAIQSVLNVG